ncbi:peroxiredoxin [Candidatus Omnitrophus magneticus]|uniref:Alkyl hydroperoxide reductase C n=1 Tax=Candidatus Omnitrophus magneticus TaxID=1609969 RepID=A0A0F0CWU6_9BACT|nr:peroxiredoxin [Candidatus Omnitrophus magneticus]
MEMTVETKKASGIGEILSDFTMEAYLPEKKDFGKIVLSDILKSGKWLILFFYPADYTFVCPTELADIGEKYDTFKKEGAEIISVSTDTHFVHMAWQSYEKLLSGVKYPMAADPTHELSKNLGVYDAVTGLSYRGTFIIDPSGKIVSTEVNYYPVGRNSDELLRKFRAFKFVNDNPAQVCPAKWNIGGKTLTPGKDLVGKVGDKLGVK